MSYRRGSDPQSNPTTRLIDLIPDDNLHVEDEDAAFYARDEDYLIHPQWRAMIQKATNRVPRRIQRFIGIYLVLLVVVWIGWEIRYGPKYHADRAELTAMDTVPDGAYGTNMRPSFKDMIHLKTLDAKYLPTGDKRMVFVGDVHGCIDELKALLAKVEFDDKRDHLVLTGDIIDKGPDSPGVVAFARKVGASCVRGNHEDKLLLSIAEAEAHHKELPGPDEAVDRSPDFLDEESHSHGDYKHRKSAKQFKKERIQWLKECPVILHVGKLTGVGDVAVVHAGLMPGIPLDEQDPYQCMNMRTVNLKSRLPSEGREGTEWAKFWNHQQKKMHEKDRMTVIYGHDAKRGLNIQKYSMGLDSGCVKGGHLSALVIDSQGQQKVFRVKCKGYVQ